MSPIDPKQVARNLALARRAAYGPVIEWEELPSLAASLDKRQAQPGASPWDATMPAMLEPVIESDPFKEPMDGVSIRELREPDVFRHFFS